MINKVLILESVREKVQFWVNTCTTEVSGFGTAHYDEENKMIVVTDAWVLEQDTFGAAHTEVKAEALQKLMELVDSEGTGRELRWWWHSHVGMAAFWSGTDTTTIKELGANGWIAATVFNNKGEVRSAICAEAKSEFGNTVWLDDNAQTLYEALPEDPRHAQWKAQLDAALAAAKKPEPPKYLGHGQQSFLGEHNAKTKRKKGKILQSTSRSEYDWMIEHDAGYLGYGLIEEAKVLGLSPIAWISIIENNNYKQLAEYEDRLEEAVKKGKLDYGSFTRRAQPTFDEAGGYYSGY